jgi:hypothetical protein
MRKCKVCPANKQFILMFSLLAFKSTKFAFKFSCSVNEIHLIINSINSLQPSKIQVLKHYIAPFLCMYRTLCTVHYPDQ